MIYEAEKHDIKNLRSPNIVRGNNRIQAAIEHTSIIIKRGYRNAVIQNKADEARTRHEEGNSLYISTDKHSFDTSYE